MQDRTKGSVGRLDLNWLAVAEAGDNADIHADDTILTDGYRLHDVCARYSIPAAVKRALRDAAIDNVLGAEINRKSITCLTVLTEAAALEAIAKFAASRTKHGPRIGLKMAARQVAHASQENMSEVLSNAFRPAATRMLLIGCLAVQVLRCFLL